jgi:hypothetical protein
MAVAAEFRRAVQHAKIGANKDISHLSRELIGKYVSDMVHFDMLTA